MPAFAGVIPGYAAEAGCRGAIIRPSGAEIRQGNPPRPRRGAAPSPPRRAFPSLPACPTPPELRARKAPRHTGYRKPALPYPTRIQKSKPYQNFPATRWNPTPPPPPFIYSSTECSRYFPLGVTEHPVRLQMKTPLKVAAIPLQQLWRDTDWIEATRGRFLTPEETKALIPDQTVPVAIASIMAPIHWPSDGERFATWNSIKSILLDGTQHEWITDQDQFYVASLWHSESGDHLLFEHHH